MYWGNLSLKISKNVISVQNVELLACRKVIKNQTKISKKQRQIHFKSSCKIVLVKMAN